MIRCHVPEHHVQNTNAACDGRRAFSLIETLMAFSLAAMLLTPVVGLLHTTREIWELCDNDRARLDSLHGTLRHVAERIRLANRVIKFEGGTKLAGFVEIEDRTGVIQRWSHSPRTATVTFSEGKQSGLLADHITSLQVSGYALDGTPVTDAASVRSLRLTVSVQLLSSAQTRTASCFVSLRNDP